MEYQKKPVNIKGWEMYQVDTEGNVYGQNGRILKYSINHRGYCIVNFNHSHKRQGFAIHTLVAKTFIENTNPLRTQVNHKNGNKKDNKVENLEWTTPKENTHHARTVLGFDNTGSKNPRAKAIQGFDKKTGELQYDFPSLADAAKFFAKENRNYRTIENIIWCIATAKDYGKKSYKGCVWRYKQ